MALEYFSKVESVDERDEGCTESYILPDAPDSLPLLPPKPVVREESPDIIEALEVMPSSVAALSRKRAAPEEEEVVAKKQKVVNAEGGDVIEID